MQFFSCLGVTCVTSLAVESHFQKNKVYKQTSLCCRMPNCIAPCLPAPTHLVFSMANSVALSTLPFHSIPTVVSFVILALLLSLSVVIHCCQCPQTTSSTTTTAIIKLEAQHHPSLLSPPLQVPPFDCWVLLLIFSSAALLLNSLMAHQYAVVLVLGDRM